MRTAGSGSVSELLAKRDTSSEYAPREFDSPRPLIPGAGYSHAWPATLPPIRTDGRLYNTHTHSSERHYYSSSSPDRDHRSPSAQAISPDRQQWSGSSASASASEAASILIDRKPRAPRPSYSEEQKFFIMYSRIMRDNTWPEIEDRFEKLFGQRSKGGLTSVYYRVRREWGLMEVLKSGPGSYAADCREVEQRAGHFSAEFLAQIGYLSGAA